MCSKIFKKSLFFAGGERKPRFDLWNILTHEGMLRLFIIQKTVLGHSAVMICKHMTHGHIHFALSGRIVPYRLKKYKYFKN